MTSPAALTRSRRVARSELVALVALVALVVLCSCTRAEAPDCAPLQAEALALIDQQRACATDDDCALFTSKLTCKGQGLRVGADRSGIDAKVAAFAACVEKAGGCPRCAKPAYVCQADYRLTNHACQEGRCASDVDAYAATPAAPRDAGR